LLIKELLLEDKKIIDRALHHYLPRAGKFAKAMRYSIFAGGKRFRPFLCLATARTLGQNPKKVIPIACALEMIHTFTLIHDDLPSMDNSDYRRGKLTCHKKFGEATAILAGDALNNFAFEILARETGEPRVIKEVTEVAMQVVEGQFLDMEAEGRKISLRKLKDIHRKKTGALICACARASAIYLKASAKQLSALNAYAQRLGLAFQITDDILDVTSTRKELGKPAGADVKKGFPYIIGVEKSKKFARQEMAKAIAALKPFGKKSDVLRELVQFVVDRKN
jgi:geranylgeranyl diphosphate synthase type II